MERASNVKDLLLAQGRTVVWLAAQLGVSKWTVHRIEAGIQAAPPGYYERAAQVLGVPLRFVLPPEHAAEPEAETVA
jgi:Helix-turn-helix domain